MHVAGKKHVVLYLTDWQIRMLKDILGVDTHVWTVPVNEGPILRYMGPQARQAEPKAKRMYLTEWQRKEIKDTTDEDCEFVELTQSAGFKYIGPPPRDDR